MLALYFMYALCTYSTYVGMHLQYVTPGLYLFLH